jgi:regulator of RNase E activity RraA
MTTTVAQDLVDRLAQLPTATLCDAYLKTGSLPPERVVMRKLQPLGSLQQRAAGPARTQQLISLRDRGRGSMVTNRHLHFELVDGTEPGDFLIVAVAGTDLLASFGDMLALKAKNMGAAGVAVDGAVRDAAYIERLELPVWCDGVTPIPQGHGGYSVASVNEPVTCAGVEVIPGDLVVADGDGVIVLPQADAADLATIAEEIEANEEHAREGVAAGTPLEDLYPSRDYYKNKEGDAK